MDNLKDNNYFINKIISDLEFITEHCANVSFSDFSHNEILVDSMLFRLIQISENSNRLTEAFKSEHPQIPWRAIKGLRNKIVHEYGEVDLTIVYDTLTKDIPLLKQAISALL